MKYFTTRNPENYKELNAFECKKQNDPNAAWDMYPCLFFSDSTTYKNCYKQDYIKRGYIELSFEDFKNIVIEGKINNNINNYSIF